MELSNQLDAPPFYPRGRAFCVRWIVGWVDPRASLDDVPTRNRTPAFQAAACGYTYLDIPALTVSSYKPQETKTYGITPLVCQF
jgi:hypothetical protein